MVVSLRARVSGVKDTEVERWDQRTWCNFTIPRFQAEGNAGRRRICHSGHQMFQQAKFNMFVCISPNLIVIVVHAARSIYLYIYIHYMIWCYMCVFSACSSACFPFLESWQDLRRVFFQKRQTRWDLVGDSASPGPGDWAIRRGWGSKTGWQNFVGSVSKLKF